MSVGDPTGDVVGCTVFAGFDFIGKRRYEKEIFKTWWEALLVLITCSPLVACCSACCHTTLEPLYYGQMRIDDPLIA